MKCLTRRVFLHGSIATAALVQVPVLVRSAAASTTGGSPLLVVVFLRGGADGLALVPPVGDRGLDRLRADLVPNAAIPFAGGAIEFALHPALAPLRPLAEAGHLAAVHAVGLPTPVRSHFDAQDQCAWGGARPSLVRQGWLARALEIGSTPADPLRAVSVGPSCVRALAGEHGALAFEAIEQVRWPTRSRAGRQALERAYHTGGSASAADRIAGSGAAALDALARLESMAGARRPLGVEFPRSALGRRLETVARLARADLGVAAAWVDAEGWDTHVRQGNHEGQLARRARELGTGLAALWEALPERRDDLLVLVVTEFGRTVRPNGSGGTDHGRAGVALAIGGRVRPGVHGPWPGLTDTDLADGRDLRVETDVRSVFAEGARHLGARDLAAVFPGYDAPRLELM